MHDKRGQISIFIILAVVIVASILGYFLLKEKIKKEVPIGFREVENYYLSCLEDYTLQGVEILQAQGGYVYNPGFEPGSMQNPFSSELDFQGIGIPYWYYVSGNNILREQIPNKKAMEKQLARFIDESLGFCDFSFFREKGYSIETGEAKTNVKINENNVEVSVKSELNIILEDKSFRKTEHKISLKTNFGKFYLEALRIYNKEKQEKFLENYALDVLRLYAPVDGVELECKPKVWQLNEVANNLKEAIEVNINSIRAGKEKSYFVQDFGVENVRFLYSKEWPQRIEVWPAENSLMTAQPIGLQAGMAAMGFCYVSYHFVYDFYFPVLIQVYDEKEIFQFPVAVIIDKNMLGKALETSIEIPEEPEICKKANTKIKVYTYDSELNPVEARISLKCLDETCPIGETKIEKGELETIVPQCGNAIIYGEAEDYVSEKKITSTNKEQEVNLLLSRKLENNISLLLDGKETNEAAVINFISDKDSGSIVWPYQKEIKISEGNYDIYVYVYKNTSISLPESRKRQCVQVASSGILGILGRTEEKCFEIVQPSQTISSVITGGGKTKQYITELELKKGKMIVKVDSLPVPKTIDDLQKNYELFEEKNAYVEFE